MQIGGGQFRKKISVPTPWYQNLCDASIFLHARPNFRKKMKKLNFQAKILPFFPPLPKYKDVFKNFSYDQTSYFIDQEQLKFR